MPLIGSTITPIVVFLPLISITGVTGAFFRALAVTVGMALLTSLALALTWTPTLSHYFIGEPTRGDGDNRRGDRRGTRRRRPAARSMRDSTSACCATALERPLAAASSAALLRDRGRVPLLPALGSDLLPEMDEGGFILDYIMPAGSSLAETNRVLTRVEQILRATPEVESTSRRTGLQLGLAAVTEANTGDIVREAEARPRAAASDEVISRGARRR